MAGNERDAMKIFWAILCASAGWSAAVWGEDLTTRAGQTYSNIVVQQYDRQGISIWHDGGSAQVLYKDILPELRGHYKALSLIPISMAKLSGEKEEPAGPNDLETLSGEIYRNVVLKQVESDTIRIAHDSGLATVYFSAIPPALREKYRTGTPVVADPLPGANDLVTAYGQVFRNIEIRRVEPDGLTFHHDGGVTKLGFPALPEELRQKYNYDPVVAWKYQRDVAAEKKLAQKVVLPEVSSVPATIAIHGIQTEKLPDDKFWVRFAVQSLIDQPQSIQIVACEQSMAAIIGGKTVVIPARVEAAMQQVVVPEIQPRYLKITAGAYQTNCVLNW
jgi:hypothetical protein